MALSDKKILLGIEKKEILIEPFNRDNLNTSSYDVTLGDWFCREHSIDSRIYNIWNEDHVRRVWGEPERALPARRVLSPYPDFKFVGFSQGDQIILVEPGETILAHTVEFIGGIKSHTTMMKARSTIGRSFIEVCKCAGWGDVGYVNRWTMEITNNSRFHTIPLVTGRRIAQIAFFRTGKTIGNYGKDGKYQDGTDIDHIKQSWDPSMMLPRLFNDREIQKEER